MKKEIFRIGSCRQCGKCCQIKYTYANINLIGKIILRWKIFWAGAKFNVETKCGWLQSKKGKAICGCYKTRPQHCQIFPVQPGDLIPGCGYSFIWREIEEEKEGENE